MGRERCNREGRDEPTARFGMIITTMPKRRSEKSGELGEWKIGTGRTFRLTSHHYGQRGAVGRAKTINGRLGRGKLPVGNTPHPIPTLETIEALGRPPPRKANDLGKRTTATPPCHTHCLGESKHHDGTLPSIVPFPCDEAYSHNRGADWGGEPGGLDHSRPDKPPGLVTKILFFSAPPLFFCKGGLI